MSPYSLECSTFPVSCELLPSRSVVAAENVSSACGLQDTSTPESSCTVDSTFLVRFTEDTPTPPVTPGCAPSCFFVTSAASKEQTPLPVVPLTPASVVINT